VERACPLRPARASQDQVIRPVVSPDTQFFWAGAAVGELRFFSQIGYGGGAACATVQQAAMAVATGTAEVVVCHHALNERSGHHFGRVAAGLAGNLTTAGIDNGWHHPMGASPRRRPWSR
jgi:acetyl-CoA acetyltransferase